jgi:hypothetical protein
MGLRKPQVKVHQYLFDYGIIPGTDRLSAINVETAVLPTVYFV